MKIYGDSKLVVRKQLSPKLTNPIFPREFAFVWIWNSFQEEKNRADRTLWKTWEEGNWELISSTLLSRWRSNMVREIQLAILERYSNFNSNHLFYFQQKGESSSLHFGWHTHIHGEDFPPFLLFTLGFPISLQEFWNYKPLHFFGNPWVSRPTYAHLN